MIPTEQTPSECPADSYEDGFKGGANYVYGLPLASRLTADEKERVRKEYAKTSPNALDQCIASLRVMRTLF